jgi:hypothetical protein
MPKCRSCDGEGYVYIEEDGRNIQDACYHCATTGEVDDDVEWADRLSAVAHTLAVGYETEHRHYCDEHSDGFALHAAENGMSEWDYFRVRVDDRQYLLAQELSLMPLEAQKVLVAWNEQPPDPLPANILGQSYLAQKLKEEPYARKVLVTPEMQETWGAAEDDIPF